MTQEMIIIKLMVLMEVLKLLIIQEEGKDSNWLH